MLLPLQGGAIINIGLKGFQKTSQTPTAKRVVWKLGKGVRDFDKEGSVCPSSSLSSFRIHIGRGEKSLRPNKRWGA